MGSRGLPGTDRVTVGGPDSVSCRSSASVPRLSAGHLGLRLVPASQHGAVPWNLNVLSYLECVLPEAKPGHL